MTQDVSSRTDTDLRETFEALIAATPQARAAKLAQLERTQPEFAQRLRALLQRDAAFEAIDGDAASTSAAAPPLANLLNAHYLGQQVGAFRLVRLLGVGGMGAVFRGERSEGGFAQATAIKILRPDALNEATRLRFQLECQALALLEHPNIARLYEVGTLADGAPYLVMEYVDGRAITVHCDALKLPLRERLQLFESICAAVAEAHRRLIVHRDLKPGNILVTRTGVVKLLDFGIAKPLGTEFGGVALDDTGTAQRFFSPLHAAPEQVRGEAVTIGCDVYGLGVLLYELCCGSLPIEADGVTAAELERRILEESPPAPSARLRATEPEHAARVAQRRGTGTGGLARALDGDIDSIVLRCLRKSARERYLSVDELARDIRNHLDARPVNARKGKALYRVRRFVARHGLAVGAAACGAIVAAAVAFAMRSQSIETHAERTRADQVTRLILSAVKAVDPSQRKEKDLSAREVFERVAAQAVADPELDPAARASILSTIAEIDVNLGLAPQAMETLERIDQHALDASQRDPIDRMRVECLIALAKYDDARALIAQHTGTPEAAPSRPRWALLEASLDYETGKLEEARDILLKYRDASLDTDVKDAMRGQLAQTYDILGPAKGDAIGEYRRLLADQLTRPDTPESALILTYSGLARAELHLEKNDDARADADRALALAEKVYGHQSLRYARALGMRQYVASASGDLPTALKMQEEELSILLNAVGEQHPSIARAQFNLGGIAGALNDRAAAEMHYRKAIEIGERVWLPTDLNRLIFRVAFACYLVGQGAYQEAREVAQIAVDNVEANPSLKEYDVFPLARAVVALGEYDAERTAVKRKLALQFLDAARDGAEGAPTKSAAAKLLGVVDKIDATPEKR